MKRTRPDDCTHICLDEIRPVGDEVLLAAHVRRRRPPLLDPDKVLGRVEALLEAGGGQKVLHSHPLSKVERHYLQGTRWGNHVMDSRRDVDGLMSRSISS